MNNRTTLEFPHEREVEQSVKRPASINMGACVDCFHMGWVFLRGDAWLCKECSERRGHGSPGEEERCTTAIEIKA